MRKSHLQPDSWREALKFINRCPICAGAYNAERAVLFGKTDNASLVHLTCEQCHSFFIAMIVMVGHGLSSVGMITDLSAKDAERIHRLPPFSIDEAIAGYELMQKNGTFNSLLIHGK